ncbi:hypothetical protein ABZP36_016214 [Zizania latifolia]
MLVWEQYKDALDVAERVDKQAVGGGLGVERVAVLLQYCSTSGHGKKRRNVASPGSPAPRLNGPSSSAARSYVHGALGEVVRGEEEVLGGRTVHDDARHAEAVRPAGQRSARTYYSSGTAMLRMALKARYMAPPSTSPSGPCFPAPPAGRTPGPGRGRH